MNKILICALVISNLWSLTLSLVPQEDKKLILEAGDSADLILEIYPKKEMDIEGLINILKEKSFSSFHLVESKEVKASSNNSEVLEAYIKVVYLGTKLLPLKIDRVEYPLTLNKLELVDTKEPLKVSILNQQYWSDFELKLYLVIMGIFVFAGFGYLIKWFLTKKRIKQEEKERIAGLKAYLIPCQSRADYEEVYKSLKEWKEVVEPKSYKKFKNIIEQIQYKPNWESEELKEVQDSYARIEVRHDL